MITKCTLRLFLFTMVLPVALVGFAQGQTTTETFNFTGGVQSWTVPQCVDNITISVSGGQGGGLAGGNGAVITGTIDVSGGDIITVDVGAAGGNGPGSGGYGGGGTGQPSGFAWPSGGGGGATTFSIGGNLMIVAGGGGGTGGGDSFDPGGAGGCANGSTGFTTFGFGGAGGTTTTGGTGGSPWMGLGPGGGFGENGTANQGGAGGIDLVFGNAPGGGGGGGVFGGGGGGSDNVVLPDFIGGGGGGGGASLVPAGFGCAQTGVGDGVVTITFSGGISATASNSGAYCEGETIELFGPANSGTFVYNWTGPNGFSSNVQNPVINGSTPAMAGTYKLILTDSSCSEVDSVETVVVVNEVPSVNSIADQTLCNGSNTQDVLFFGVVGGATYSWTNTNTNTGLAANGTGDILSFPGNAIGGVEISNIEVTPSTQFCTGTPEQFSITVFTTPTVTVSNDTTICENGTATISASSTGGTTYAFHWNMTSDLNSIQSVNPSGDSSYEVYAENEVGCISPTETINVSLYPPLSATISPFDTICPGYPTHVFANCTDGIGQPYTFSWSSGELQTGPGNHQIVANPPATTTYTVTVTDGCESTPLVMSTEIFVAPLPVPQYKVLDPEQCEPAVFHIVNTTEPASQSNYWFVEPNMEFVNQDTIATNTLMAGSYDIQMIVTSHQGCVDSLTFEDAIQVKPKPTAEFKYSPSPVLMFNTDVLFTNYSSNGYTYHWYFQDGNPSQSTQTNARVMFPDGQTGSYEVMLITTSELGCVDTTVRDVIVHPEVLIYAPNAFTPNGDQFNQNWRVQIEGIDIYDFELLIINRWGEIVWESNDIEAGWDGTYAGENAQTGIYNWIIRAKDLLNDASYTWEGHINLLR